ncbi:hypothetical protein Bca4012_009045 [Brassica carinata]
MEAESGERAGQLHGDRESQSARCNRERQSRIKRAERLGESDGIGDREPERRVTESGERRDRESGEAESETEKSPSVP